MKTVTKTIPKHILVLDSQTKELLDEFVSQSSVQVPERKRGGEFFFGFMEPCEWIDALPAPVIKFLCTIMQSCRKNTNTFSVDKQFFDEYGKRLGVGQERMKKLVIESLKHGAIIRVVKGKYMIHPEIFWVGSLKTRAKVLERLMLEKQLLEKSKL